MQHDTVIDNGPGNVVLLDMQNVLQALATCMSGPVAPTKLTPGMFWLDTSGAPFLRQRNRDNTNWALVAGMPDKATAAEAVAGLDASKYLTPFGVAQAQAALQGRARNRLVNPAMQISQENADTAGTTGGYFPADQWGETYGGGAHSIGRVSSVTPRGSLKRLRWTVTTAKASPLASTDIMFLYQPVEGIRVADFAWGTAGARRVIVRFGFRGPAGTYAASIRNGSSARSYIKTFTIAAGQANVDTEQTFAIPGDVVGTWPVDNTLGLYVGVSLACGSGYQGVDGVWQASNPVGTPACTNGMATVGNTFELFDAGLYLDLDGTGVPPPFQIPDEASELRACQRYFCSVYLMYSQNIGAAVAWYGTTVLPVDLRTASPTFTHTNVSQSANFPATGAYSMFGMRTVRESRVATAVGTSSFFHNYVDVNARM